MTPSANIFVTNGEAVELHELAAHVGIKLAARAGSANQTARDRDGQAVCGIGGSIGFPATAAHSVSPPPGVHSGQRSTVYIR